MLRNTVLVISLLCVGFLIACSKTETTNSTAGSDNKAASNSASTSSTSSTTASSGDKIGIAECDDFIAKYDACVSSKVPENMRAQFKGAIDQWRKAWKQAAANPATKGTLAAACKQAADQQNAAMKAYGCSF